MALIDDLLDLAERPRAELPGEALAMARLSLVDWVVCGRAALDVQVAATFRAFADTEGGRPTASLFGGGRTSARTAAMVNAVISHALDLDDTHLAHIGHLSVGIYPAVVALGEEAGASAEEVVAAFLVGAEGAVRVGVTLGAAHYDRGFHQTGTAGAFGATIAAGRILGLTRDEMRSAIGLCASRAGGLRSLFGTMAKPYNAGTAASNGVEVARLAKLGLTAGEDGLSGHQGFIPTHTEEVGALPGPDRFLFLDNTYKFHACCHGLHAMIEALGERPAGFGAAEVAGVEVRTNPRWLTVCDIKAPKTGGDVKFSYAWLAGMVLHDIPTGNGRLYTDELAADPVLTAFASRVSVAGDAGLGDGAVAVTLTARDGATVDLAHDVTERPTPEALEARLAVKARTLLGPEGDTLAASLAGAGLSAADIGAILRGDRAERASPRAVA
ncbi:MmgE/PrpD family protein [Acuticoccus sediminis]|uniref:MmgE/PrpD family protein n=1 Tax=Acuticoccus sediminis TaxID=2184697 RepID=UPI001CFC6F09|nr:MmgE/PrpD family protein [Acuticoccus sediminis]